MMASYSVWAPAKQRVDLHVERDGQHSRVPMRRDDRGWWRAPTIQPRAGDMYGFVLDGRGPFPDPRSLAQPLGVHGLSEVVDVSAVARRVPWGGRDLLGAVLYEMHVGTFHADRVTGSAGTFDSAIERLDHLVELGVEGVEVMPVAAFPGERGWGYDGVGLYATHDAYGGPLAFRRFIDAAHERGLAVVLDVVYNHLGPAGNYLGEFGPYFTDSHTTPWGPAVNLDAEHSDEVREFIIDNARQWLVDFGVDGLRLDAVHALADDSPSRGGLHILAELRKNVDQWSADTNRALTLIAESDLNDDVMLRPVDQGGYGQHAQWADDIHHALHAWVSGERQGYYVDFGDSATVKKTLESIFEHDGGYSTFRRTSWGSVVDRRGDHYDANAFVAFVQNHDQVGNRARGDRVHHSLSVEQHAAVAGLYLLGAATPMLFMGEEWAASSPFPFFSDHDDELGPLVTQGRTQEFARMGWEDDVPDPQARPTFESAWLNWDEIGEGAHARTLETYRALLRARREHAAFRDGSFSSIRVDVLGSDAVVMHRGAYAVLAARGGGPWVLQGAHSLVVSAGNTSCTSSEGPDDSLMDVRLDGAGVVVARVR